jgi:hypothetical protein
VLLLLLLLLLMALIMHEAHGDVNTSHSEAVSHDVAKEAAEHESI